MAEDFDAGPVSAEAAYPVVGKTITMNMDNIPLGEVLRYIALGAGLEVHVEPHAVILSTPGTVQRWGGDTTAIRRKLAAIVIPQIEFDDFPVAEVVQVLKRRSIELDPDGEGVNIVLHMVNTGMTADAGGETLAVQWAVVREFPKVVYDTPDTDVRDDFRECVHWDPHVCTNVLGYGQVEFCLNDAVTSFRVTAEGNAMAGQPGRGELVLDSRTQMHVAANVPVALSAGDELRLPVVVTNETDAELPVSGAIAVPACLVLPGGGKAFENATIPAHQAKTFHVAMAAKVGEGTMLLTATSPAVTDRVTRHVAVAPVGFPSVESQSGYVTDKETVKLVLPQSTVDGSIKATVRFYPSPLAAMQSGLESILREPYGCFEQASSATYPNVMVLQYLRRTGPHNAEVQKRAVDLIAKGYQRLVGFQCKSGGFDWFGREPAHEALTAYGILEFTDMAAVWGGVDEQVVERARSWLLSRRDGKGAFQHDPRSLDHFGGADPQVSDAYIVWALAEAGVTGLEVELEQVVLNARTSGNPYQIALALLAKAKTEPSLPPVVEELGEALRKCQGPDGAFQGKGASITGSTGHALTIETTALAIMAFRVGADEAANRGLEWLVKQRTTGGFGGTQATILALKAIAGTGHSAAGVVSVSVNGAQKAEFNIKKGEEGVVTFPGLEELVHPGENTFLLSFAGNEKERVAYSVDVEYTTLTPKNSEEGPVRLDVTPGKSRLGVGDVIPVTLRLQNTSGKALPMTLARIGVPGGMRPEFKQLKDLQENGVVDFSETTPREVVLYFGSLPASARKEVVLNLRADVPGTFTGRASCAYLYYSRDVIWWAEPLRVQIAP
ncbi:MAG: hypothetical protein A3K19_33110 [Lentisphaerae bacterium RIFOXYB12_FULL_65_16]|nr:MAG: hypothetical protein A3K19_33110 [Lentisphaerae bacterium RIFOXYB12_FULL_65_16]